jgi:hypothetical protein
MVLTRGGARAARAKEKDRPFRILDLPSELVQLIFDNFTEDCSVSLLDIRRVCRAFRDNSLIAFGTSFFYHVGAILHPLSLTVLFEIASHPELSKFVRQITISGEQVGSSIDLSGHEDEQRMKDLHKSMKRSGLDHTILTDVFRKLPGLTTVRLDDKSYLTNAEVVDAVRCGSTYILTKDTKWNIFSSQRGTNRAFRVVFACLRNAGLAGKVDIELSAEVKNASLAEQHLL